MTTFDPNEHRTQVEGYLGRALGETVRLAGARELAKSTRDAPWRLDVGVGGEARSYVLRLASRP